MKNPGIADTWERGSPYEQYMGRWSRQLAPVFLNWLRPAPQGRWLDLGCGTGALAAAIVDGFAPAAVDGVDPSAGFLETARERLGDKVRLHRGDASLIPLQAGAVDVAASALVLNFVPDTRAALAEMLRVTTPGGTVAACVWDYAGRMDLVRFFWDAAVALDTSAAQLDEGVRFGLCRRSALLAAWTRAGLEDVAVEPLDLPVRFTDFDDYWQPFLGGQGPAPAYAMALDEDRREALRERLRERLHTNDDGSIPMLARAWAVRGRKPA